MLHRHRWSALFVFALVVLAAVLYTVSSTPIYECTPALIEVTADNAGIARLKSPPNVLPIRVMCSGRVSPEMVLRAFRSGADGVMVLG